MHLQDISYIMREGIVENSESGCRSLKSMNIELFKARLKIIFAGWAGDVKTGEILPIDSEET